MGRPFIWEVVEVIANALIQVSRLLPSEEPALVEAKAHAFALPPKTVFHRLASLRVEIDSDHWTVSRLDQILKRPLGDNSVSLLRVHFKLFPSTSDFH